MDFAAALEKAIAAEQRQGFIRAAAVTVICAGLGAAVFIGTKMLAVLFPLVVFAAVSWFVAIAGTATTKALSRLRGAQPGEAWLPSPSHGLLVATSEVLVGGGLAPAELNRHARRRITSISYDEPAHQLTVDVTAIVQTRDGEREELDRSRVKLDSAVTPERGYAFAKHVLGLSQR